MIAIPRRRERLGLSLFRYPGRGQGEGSRSGRAIVGRATTAQNPHPSLLPEYREKEKGQRRRPRRRGGFTLIEILATLLLLGIVMPVAMRGISIALASADHARHVAEAATLAETKLNDLLTQGVSSASGLTGDFSPDHPEYQWSYQSAPRDFSVNQVQLRVTWLERGQARTFDLSTLSYDTQNTTTGGLP